jgi:hypothetical protein
LVEKFLILRKRILSKQLCISFWPSSVVLCDGQFDVSELDHLVSFLEDYIVLIGYRPERADSFIRTLNAWLCHIYIWMIFGLNLKDIDCAFKIFPKTAYESVKPIKSDGALFSAELPIKLIRNGIGIKEIPVSHFPRLFGEQTGVRSVLY